MNFITVRYTILTFVLIACSHICFATQAEDLNSLLSKIKICAIKHENLIVDREIEGTQAFKDILSLIPTHSNTLVSSWSNVNLTRNERVVAIATLESALSHSQYVDVLSVIIMKWEKGEIDDTGIEPWIIGAGAKIGFLAWHFDKPTIQALIMRLKPLEDRKKLNVSKLLSGSGRKFIEEYNRNYSGTLSQYPVRGYDNYVDP